MEKNDTFSTKLQWRVVIQEFNDFVQYVRWCLFLRRATLSAMLDHSVAISVEETREPKS